MMRAVAVATVVLIIALVAGCGPLVPANAPATAARVLTQASYGGSGSPRDLAARTIQLTFSADFTGSDWATEAAAAILAYGITFTDQQVVQDGNTYVLDGTLNYAISITSSGDPAMGSFTAYLYGSGIHISGPDYEGDVTADYSETVTWQVSGTTVTMTCNVTGTVGGVSVSQSVSFSFEGT
jgi:hypothetical protein